MDDTNIRRFNRITRAKTYGQTYAEDFAPGSKASELFLELDPIIAELNKSAVDQLRTPVGKPELIAALSADFKDIARTARAIKLDDPAFDSAPYRHPATSAIDTLLSQAQAIVTRLDAAIQNKYSRNPDKLAAWKSASRIERPAKKAAAPVTPPPTA